MEEKGCLPSSLEEKVEQWLEAQTLASDQRLNSEFAIGFSVTNDTDPHLCWFKQKGDFVVPKTGDGSQNRLQ
jgi:hypothetical protein